MTWLWPTSQICYQQLWSPIFVTNIDLTQRSFLTVNFHPYYLFHENVKVVAELKGVILDFGQNRPILENLQILNRWSKIDSDFFNRTPDAPKRAWTIVSWPQRPYRFLSADKQRGLLNLRIRSTGATVDRFWCVDYHFDGNGLNKSLQVFVLWYLSLEDRKALSCERQFFRKSFISEISL